MHRIHTLKLTLHGLQFCDMIIAKRKADRALDIEGREPEVYALLSTVCGRTVTLREMRTLKRAGYWYARASDKDIEYADYPFFLSLHRPLCNPGEEFPTIAICLATVAMMKIDADEAGKERLIKMQTHMNKGHAPAALLRSWGIPSWEELRKDDGGGDDDGGDDGLDDEGGDSGSSASSDDSDGSSGSGGGHYDPDEPRIPAGQPGGGQWTTAGNGTVSDSGSISVDDVRNNPADTVTQVGSITPVAYTTTATDANADNSTGDFDIDSATDYLRESAQPGSINRCASYVADAIRSEDGGGLTDLGYPPTGDAKDYGQPRINAGFVPVVQATDANACNIYPPPGYTPQAGDVVVMQPYPGGNSSRHMAMYDGTQWISDFVQIDMWGGKGYRTYAPPYVIYRYPPSD